VTGPQWETVKRVFHEALDRPVDGRTAWITQQCRGDPEVGAEVERLITAHLDAGSFIDIPVTDLHAERPPPIALAAGTRLGPYEVVALIGAGGMGEVYRGRDTRLGRTVAIKILPGHLSSDPNHRARLEREAKSIAGLTHPHICTLHDIGEHAGAMFLVMEHLDGETLAHRLEKGPLEIEQALTIATELADALSAAHRQDIIHRDLKPANVMLTKGGAKLLDFGLAKLTGGGGQGVFAPLVCPPTRSAPLTGHGVIVGTVAYMSPEQAEGKTVDPRSDIFSFGALLYEMVTGRRAFDGDTSVSTLVAILQKEPPPLEDAPPELERIIARCLRKDPDRRIQHMMEVKLALEELKAESDSGALPAAVLRRRPWVSRWAVGAMGVVVVATASVAFWLTSQPTPLGAPVLTQLTRDTGLTTDPALSPDGKMLAYASDRSGRGDLDIWVRQLGGGEPIPLTQDSADEREPTFSPDGTLIAFRSERDGGGIYVVSALGGPPRMIAPEGRRPRFSPDGGQIAYWSGDIGQEGAGFSIRNFCRIFVVGLTGNVPKQVQPDFLGAAYPEWAPDGTHVLFLGNRDEKLPVDQSIDWWVTPLDQGPAIATGALKSTREAQLNGPFFVYPWALIATMWQQEGRALIFSARSGDNTNLWRIGISPRTWKVQGAPERLTSSPTREESPSVASMPDGSLRIAFASLSEILDIWGLPLQAETGKVSGEMHQLTRDSTADFHAALSADGRKMVWVSARSGDQEVWIKDLTTGKDAALTADRGDKFLPRFSPDGRKVSFATSRAGTWNVYVAPAAGGAAEMICEDCGVAGGWSPDGRYLIGHSVDGRLYMVEVASRRRIDLVALGPRWFCCGDISPDGRWISFFEGLRTHVAPFQGETPPPESSWVSGSGLWGFSPDWTLAYSFYDHDGFKCIGAQRLDRATMRPV
jgi:Tol biopolymer transport system component